MEKPVRLEQLETIASTVVREHAVDVDAQARFPKEAISFLQESGYLGLLSSAQSGGMGLGLREAATIVERLARECPSTAMIMCMHYCGVGLIEKLAKSEQAIPDSILKTLASGQGITTLAFSESGSRSHFWAPQSSATRKDDLIVLNAHKSWVTSANHATWYIWSSKPVEKKGASSLWLVPRKQSGLKIPDNYKGLGLRGNDSTPVLAEGVAIPESYRLGADGSGFSLMMEVVLPHFSVMSTACSIGIMEATLRRSIDHVCSTRLSHMDSSLADMPTIRAYLARMQIATDRSRCLWHDTLEAIESGRSDSMLRILECKATAAESALEVCSSAMRVCGGAAYRKDVGVERFFRDAQAANIMAPTTDLLYDFIGKAICGLDLF